MSGEVVEIDAAPNTVTYGDVTFRIRKLLPMPAKAVFMDHVRPLLRGALSADMPAKRPGSGEDDVADVPWMKVALAAFTDAPGEHYKEIVKALYSKITYQRADMSKPMPLLNREDHAFQNLDMAHSLALDARAFIVNFSASFSVAASEFPHLAQVFQSLKQSTSTPSSPTP